MVPKSRIIKMNGNDIRRNTFDSYDFFSKCLKGVLFMSFLATMIRIPFTAAAGSTARDLDFENLSGSSILVYWVNPDTHELYDMTGGEKIPNNANVPFGSFVGHEFEIHQASLCNISNGEQTCGRIIYQVSEKLDQVIRITKDFDAVDEQGRLLQGPEGAALVTSNYESDTIQYIAAEDAIILENEEDNTPVEYDNNNKEIEQRRKGNIVKDCQSRYELTDSDDSNSQTLEESINDIYQCVEQGFSSALELFSDEIHFQSNIRSTIGHKLENYTCDDNTLQSSIPVRNETWLSDADNLAREVYIMLDRPASRVHVVEDFISEDECDAMESRAQKSLHHATVADGKGGSRLSESRKAMQAGIIVPWSSEANGDPVARLSRRVYDYTNNVLRLNISEHGQEDLMSIQYNGRGRNDTAPDRYTPHCDGDCTGLPHKSGTRMATMVMYCKVPEVGGHTNFPNAGVHVKAKIGSAVFFSYIDPITKTMDNAMTRHSGCPVYEGAKRIVTQWIRLGVDSDNAWDSFNTLGIQTKDLSEF